MSEYKVNIPLKNIYRTALELAESNGDDDDTTLSQIMDWRRCTRYAAKQLLYAARDYATQQAQAERMTTGHA